MPLRAPPEGRPDISENFRTQSSKLSLPGYLRRLLVGCAQYILGPFGPDSDLKRHGLMLAARGGGRGKRKAVVATARKLAVLMLTLWKHGRDYEPLRGLEPAQAA